MTILHLVLGDQLNIQHSHFKKPDPNTIFVMMEVRQETDYVLHHAQKIIAIFAAMRDFAHTLDISGHRVHYFNIDDPLNTHNITTNLDSLINLYQVDKIIYQAPDEWRLDQQLFAYASQHHLPVEMIDTEHFITQRDEAQHIFKGRKQWLMEFFYRQLRTKHHVLMQDPKTPVDGQWNFDQENRKPWRGKPTVPPDHRSKHDHSVLWATIQKQGVKSFGNPQEKDFRWPLNRTEALLQLEDFITQRLVNYGDYQDAMTHSNWRMFHALISFALNVKMLSPLEVIQRAQYAWQHENAPIAAVEGFIRQILGWREYVRGIYWAHMPEYVESNALSHYVDLPKWFWTGETKMNCLAKSIGQSLEHAYAHHIQRLMVIGNFALLAGINPQQVHAWYLGVYIDAFEWVELPNTVGMSQYADHGIMATKPYVSSAAYIDRMSDYCKGCHYDKKVKTGDRACPFNALYWHFYDRHRASFERNPRIGMAYRQLEKMPVETRQALNFQAMSMIKNIDKL